MNFIFFLGRQPSENVGGVVLFDFLQFNVGYRGEL